MSEILKDIQDICKNIKENENYGFEESWRSGNDYYWGYGQACQDIYKEINEKIIEKYK